ATVVLPTPPLPLAMATRFLMPGMACGFGCWCGAGPGGILFFLRTGATSCATARKSHNHALMPWHFLYFLPEPHGQGSLRPTFAPVRTGFGASAWPAPV